METTMEKKKKKGTPVKPPLDKPFKPADPRFDPKKDPKKTAAGDEVFEKDYHFRDHEYWN